MRQLNSRIPSYEQATFDMMSAVFSEIMDKTPLLNYLGPPKKTRHGGVVRNIQGEEPLDQGYEQISAQVNIDYQVVKSTDIASYTRTLSEIGQSLTHQQSAGFIKSLNEMFDHSRRQE